MGSIPTYSTMGLIDPEKYMQEDELMKLAEEDYDEEEDFTLNKILEEDINSEDNEE